MSAKYLKIIEASEFVQSNKERFEGIKLANARQLLNDELQIDISCEIIADLLDRFEIKRYGKGANAGSGTHSNAKAHNKIRNLSLYVLKLAEHVGFDVPQNIKEMARPSTKEE